MKIREIENNDGNILIELLGFLFVVSFIFGFGYIIIYTISKVW